MRLLTHENCLRPTHERPDDQVTRCKIVMRAIIAGNWEDAAFTLNAAANEATGEWAADAKALADHCRNVLSREQ